jgi:hypothetical protein
VPARPVGPQPVAREDCFPAYGTAPGAAVDPISRAMDRLAEQVEELRARVVELEAREPVHAGGEDAETRRRVAG